jgi:hypothetical protein
MMSRKHLMLLLPALVMVLGLVVIAPGAGAKAL